MIEDLEELLNAARKKIQGLEVEEKVHGAIPMPDMQSHGGRGNADASFETGDVSDKDERSSSR